MTQIDGDKPSVWSRITATHVVCAVLGALFSGLVAYLVLASYWRIE
jgi:hypothetical protein